MPKPFIVADFETDPFIYRAKPEVFLSGWCDGTKTVQWWGDDAIPQFCAALAALREPHYIFFHNGGKFDFFYLPWPLSDPIRIINGRIVSARFGRHILRDSFAFLPFGLAQYAKTEIDYEKFKRDAREEHKAEIMQYHRDDLVSTYELVDAFIKRFGIKLTIASTAIKELTKIHPVERKGESHDEKFRKYYFGGRVEAFHTGTINGRFTLYDVNSMYPHVMAHRNHPSGIEYEFTCDWQRLLRRDSCGFATVTGFSKGVFPLKNRENGKLEFPKCRAQFNITLHELQQAVALGTFDVDEIQSGFIARQTTNFKEFVYLYAEEKRQAKKNKDRIGELFAKLILNSAYGKFGANPENYFDYRFILDTDPFPFDNWEIFEDWGWLIVLRRPSLTRPASYYDVAVAASITGAARAELMRAIASSKSPLYCDTDSLICEKLDLPVGDGLGEWKIECEADTAHILGKKMYALTKNGECVKKAAKGIRMELKDYLTILKGDDYTYFRDAPSFKKDGSATFINRTIKGKAQLA